jgi:uncharacterized repeat protein (TIGR01451 family)
LSIKCLLYYIITCKQYFIKSIIESIWHKGGENIRKQTFLILITLLLAIILSGTVSAADGDVIYVNGSSGLDTNDGFTPGTAKLTINNATGTVNPNGIVNIADGTYSGENNTNITIDRNMTIIGESQTGTIISPISPGRIFFINSDLTVNLHNLTIQNCLVTEVGENGGAIYNNGSNLNVNNCKFTNTNVAVGNGGAIYNNGGNLTINTSTFTSNSVVTGGNGGAIYNNGGNLTINTSTFINNKIGMSGDGGAIYNNGGNLTINTSTFTSNTANLRNGGGAICNNGGNLTITTSTFTSNTANMSVGGAICNNGGNLTINTSTFTSNSATTGGGAISNGGGILVVTSSTFTSNYIIPLLIGLVGDGGAIYNSGGNLTINTSTFTSNTAANAGAICTMNGNSNITGSIFTGNSASNIGGGAIVNMIGTMKVTGSIFTGNVAPMGGAINNGGLGSGGTLEVTNCTFTSNTALDIPGGGLGGAISNLVGNLLVTCSTFTGNTAGINEGKGKGSAIFNGGGDAIINFNRIVGNSPSNGEIAGERIDATLNWWGSNLSPVGKINEIVGGIILFDPWITLNITADPTSILNGGSSTVNASLLSDNQGNYHDPALGHVPDIQVTLTVPWGNFITGKTFTLYTIDSNITATFYANEGPVNPLYNPVRVDASADSYTTNALEATYINIITVANLNITKTANVTTANIGDVVRFTINITNNGPDNVTAIELEDTFSLDGFEGLPVMVTPAADSLSYLGMTGILKWTNILDHFGGILLPGNSVSILLDLRVNETAAGTTLYNKANITSIAYPYFNESTVSVHVNQANVELNKTVNNTRPNVGETVVFTIVATNNGPDTANNLVVTDTLPAGLDFVSCTDGGLWDPLTRTVTWPAAVVANDGNVTYYLTALVNSTSLAGTNVTNMVNETHDEHPGYSTANCMVYVPKSDLYIQITSDKNNPKVGETFTLTYKLGNNGPDDATNVTITIPIPEGFHISSITGDGNWSIVGNNIIWTLNNVTVGDPYLYITGWTTAAGNYIFTASINSNTFNLNSRGVNSLSINAQPQVNAATSNTIGMQTTGAPIAGIVLAILMVLGGFIGTRKKQ